ncbi:Pycsar system effector family protein [Ochrovirga pacifica]|uniref:Pycsar system effector family protein n=1 Tax=Ochrovirga pacifica TaxID=1042376 RepID=UPI000255A80B|nr:Pycsar system effector family protein [Ochrovirga pacifica]
MKSPVVDSAELYVVNYLKHNLPTGTLYHGISHTQDVVDAVKTLIKEEKISNDEAECVLIAAWFHDVGYAKGSDAHEERSIEEAVGFLKDHEYPDDKIKKVIGCIRATQMPQEPKTKIEKIICDADLVHVATTSFEDSSKLLRAEWELLEGKTLTDVEWFQCNSDFLRGHKFYTNFAFRHWSAMKASNLAANEKKLKNAIQKEDDALLKREKKILKASKKEVNKKEQAGKTIETMYRVTLKNHIKLSDIADTKANILLSVNAIILSLALANLFPKLDKVDNQYLIIPTIIFLITAVVSIVFAVLSTRPKVTSGTFTQQDIEDKKVNLLFFGNFHKMPLDVFDKGMFTLMEDKEYLYKSLNKDLYFLGVVLAKKYKLLRLTYAVFMVGIVVSVISFGIAFYNLGLQ